MTRKLQFLFTALLLTVGVTGAWAGDFIDDATAITVYYNSTDNDPTINTVESKKQLVFTPSAGEFQMKFTLSDYSLNAGQVFAVVEMSDNLNTSGAHKVRKMTIDGTNYENTNNHDWLTATVNTNHKIAILSLLSNIEGLRTYCVSKVNTTMTATYAQINIAATAASETTIYRAGLYTLGEILELYPELKTKNWQINHNYRLLNDGSNNANNSATNNGSDNGWIETKNNASAITTLAGCKLFIKALGLSKLPDNYRYFYMRFLQPSDEASKEDLFADINENATLMLSFGTGSNPHSVAYLPTMHKKLIDFDRNMFNYTFVDGVAPSLAEKVDVKGSQSTNYGTYSRSLKAGYNSCAMPFKKIANESDIPAGLTFYKVASYSSGTIIFSKMSSSDLTASNAFTNGSDWTPVIIHAENAGIYTFVGRDAITDWGSITYSAKNVGGSDNKVKWVGSFVNEVPSGDYTSTTNYGINSAGTNFLKMAADTKTTYYRAFLADGREPGARALTLSFDDEETTGISASLMNNEKMNYQYFDLSGRRVVQPTKGLYIVNGKKVIIK